MHRADTEETNFPWVEGGSSPPSSLAGTNVTVAVIGIFHFFARDTNGAGNLPFTARFPALCTRGIPTQRAGTTSELRQDPTPGTGRGGQRMTPESSPKPRAGARRQMTTAFPRPGTHHPQVPCGLIKSPSAIQRANSCQGPYCFSSCKYGMATRSTFLGNILF